MHEPVLVREVIDLLHIQNQALYIDATVGAGGHSCEIIKNGGIVLGIDADQSMLAIAQKKLEACPSPDNVGGSNFTLVHGNFSQIKNIAQSHEWSLVSGILIDLGVSNVHFASPERGFSFSNPKAMLDMRLDPSTQQIKASDLLNTLREDQLQVLFERVLNRGEARSISKKAVAYRNTKPFETVEDLLNICGNPWGKTHPATKPFLALRMAVNSEMENIEEVIPACLDLLKKAGRLAIITFHSTEDRLVKQIFEKLENERVVKNLTQKPIEPGKEELEKNRKARSAKLRVIEKL